MKKTALSIILFLLFGTAHSQISLEATYNHSATYTKLANSGYKYFLMDVSTSQCRIYNTNHSLWKTLALSVPVNNYLYDIKYVSENLFTTDNSLCLLYIYYNYNSTGQYYTYMAKVVKENGTELLSIPGCQYVYVYNIAGVGTKMFTYSYDYSSYPYPIQTRVYNLPGQLITQANEPEGISGGLWGSYPNPTSQFTTIRYELPKGIASAELVITNLVGEILKTYPVEQHSGRIEIPASQYPAGVYLYFLRASDYQSKAEKLIVY